MEKSSEQLTIAKKKYKVVNKENSKALNNFKEAYKDSPEYLEYSGINSNYKQALKEYKEILQNEKFLGFKNFRVFAYELFPILALFVYVILNLFKSFKNNYKAIGPKIIHLILINYCLFKMFWVFNLSENLSRFEYYFALIFSTFAVCLGVWFIHKREQSWEKKVQKRLLEVSYHAMLNCDEDRVEDMAKIIEQPIK